MHNIYTANNNPEIFQPLTSDIENSNVYGLLVLKTDVKALIDIKIKLPFFLTWRYKALPPFCRQPDGWKYSQRPHN